MSSVAIRLVPLMKPISTRPALPFLALLFAGVVAAGCSEEAKADPQKTSSMPNNASNTVTVRDYAKDRSLAPATTQSKVVKTDAEWRKILSPEAFQVARGKGTERPFCGVFYDNHQVGTYDCACCGLPLFRSDAKFDSGTGWPSFFQPIAKENVAFIEDRSHGMTRTEILCTRCDGHLGHVFEDGPKPTGLRFCLNSVSLTFVPDAPAVKTGGKTDHQ